MNRLPSDEIKKFGSCVNVIIKGSYAPSIIVDMISLIENALLSSRCEDAFKVPYALQRFFWIISYTALGLLFLAFSTNILRMGADGYVERDATLCASSMGSNAPS